MASVGLFPVPPLPAGLCGPCGQAERRDTFLGESPEVPPSLKACPPEKLFWGSGGALQYGIFKRERLITRSAVVFTPLNPDCAEIS